MFPDLPAPWEALAPPWQTLALVAVSTTGVYLALIAFSRLAGLRSFAEMTNFDMAATVAFGSITATTAVTKSTSLLQGVVALGVLFAVQFVLAQLRRRRAGEMTLDSAPLLLMDGERVLEENLDTAQMTRSDLRAKLRLAGVTRYEQVGKVVLETTGTVSVVRADPSMEPDLFASVRGS